MSYQLLKRGVRRIGRSIGWAIGSFNHYRQVRGEHDANLTLAQPPHILPQLHSWLAMVSGKESASAVQRDRDRFVDARPSRTPSPRPSPAPKRKTRYYRRHRDDLG